jgi:hypothetical protein
MGISILESNYLKSGDILLFHKTWSDEVINYEEKIAAFTYTLPANMLKLGDSLEIEVMGIITTAGSDITVMTVDFGTTNILSVLLFATDVTVYQHAYKVVVPTSSTTQISTRTVDDGFDQITNRVSATEDLSGAVDITFNLDNQDTTTGSRILLAKVKLLRGTG